MMLPRLLLAGFASILFGTSLSCQDPATPQPAGAQAPAIGIEKPLLWRIELPTPSYLYGTIHVPDPRVTKLPPVVDDAIASCGALFTEIPMEMDKMMAMAKAVMLPSGTRLADLIGDELYARTKTYVESRGASMSMFDRVQPWVATTQLMVIDLLPQMATRQPLDMQLYSEAKKDGKTVGGLETVESQIAVFDGLDNAEQRSMLTSTLDQLEEDAAAGKNSTAQLIELYLRGDENAIDRYTNDYQFGDKALSEKLMQRLLANRNGGMVDRIVEQLQQHPARGSFFAVGAAHYGGEQGIVVLLQQRGYRITRMELQPGGAAAKTEAEAIDAELARREQESAALRARRQKLMLLR